MPDHSHVCPWWVAYTFDNPLRKLFHNPEKLFYDAVRPGMVVADIGCGMGYFSIGLARLVAPTGSVIAVDMQPQMLAKVDQRARRTGLSDRIQTQQCLANRLGLERNKPLDFVLAFWMVHETPDHLNFFRQLGRCLKSSGRIMVTEPRFHVSPEQFDGEMAIARQAGFRITYQPKVAFSHAAMLKPNHGD